MPTSTNSDNRPTFENLRAVFCHTRRCRPEKFVRKVFWRTLNRAAFIPAVLGGGSRAEGYQKDLETIEAIGDARSPEELERALEEFFTLNLLERDFWRGTVGLRVSGDRLARLFRPLAAKLRPAVESVAMEVSTASAVAPDSVAAPESSDSTRLERIESLSQSTSAESQVVTLRKLRRMHELVVGGTLLGVAVREVGLDVHRLEGLLDSHVVGHPELAWLQSYVMQQRELDLLRNDNARLTRLVADLTIQLNQNSSLRHAA